MTFTTPRSSRSGRFAELALWSTAGLVVLTAHLAARPSCQGLRGALDRTRTCGLPLRRPRAAVQEVRPGPLTSADSGTGPLRVL